MTQSKEDIQAILDECLNQLDLVAKLVADHKMSKGKKILTNVGEAVGNILRAKKQIKDEIS
jgi:hypothetical protein